MAQIIDAARRFSTRCGGQLGAIATAVALVAVPVTGALAQSSAPRTENVFEDEVRRPAQGLNRSNSAYGRAIDPSAAFGEPEIRPVLEPERASSIRHRRVGGCG